MQENFNSDENKFVEYENNLRLSHKNGDEIPEFFCVFCGKIFSHIDNLRKNLQVHKEGNIKTDQPCISFPLGRQNLQEIKEEILKYDQVDCKGGVYEQGLLMCIFFSNSLSW